MFLFSAHYMQRKIGGSVDWKIIFFEINEIYVMNFLGLYIQMGPVGPASQMQRYDLGLLISTFVDLFVIISNPLFFAHLEKWSSNF